MTEFVNRRMFERRPLVAAAAIIFEDDAVVKCSTIDISAGGVKLIFPRDVVLPDNFRVTVASTRVRQRKARMVWRNGDELGVRFV